MAKLSGKPPRVELYCKKNDDGAIDAGILDDGSAVSDSDLMVLKGDCKDIQELWNRARDRYGVNPEIGPDCQDCFPASFLEVESIP